LTQETKSKRFKRSVVQIVSDRLTLIEAKLKEHRAEITKLEAERDALRPSVTVQAPKQ
jgi:hypothetical protein